MKALTKGNLRTQREGGCLHKPGTKLARLDLGLPASRTMRTTLLFFKLPSRVLVKDGFQATDS
jgi:hypothetical protein